MSEYIPRVTKVNYADLISVSEHTNTDSIHFLRKNGIFLFLSGKTDLKTFLVLEIRTLKTCHVYWGILIIAWQLKTNKTYLNLKLLKNIKFKHVLLAFGVK